MSNVQIAAHCVNILLIIYTFLHLYWVVSQSQCLKILIILSGSKTWYMVFFYK